jgi:EmrB/QacA subfamily drug resistance transporter
VAARVLQAIGASMLMSNSPAIVSVTFPGKERGRVLGMNGTVVALAAMAGPSLGGILVGLFNWQWIFYINLPIGIIAYLLGYYILPKEEQHSSGTFDFMGAALFAVGMTGLLVVLSQGEEWGWNSLAILITTIVSIIILSIFVWNEGRATHPMIDLTLFKRWPFSAGNVSGLLSFMAMYSSSMLMPFYLHSVMLLTPTQIGLAITPFPLLMAVAAPVSGYLSERVSPVILTTSGLGILASGLVYLSTLNAQSVIWQVIIGQAVMGIGNGMFQSPNNNSVLSSVPVSKVGLASGISALMRNVGMVSGTAVAVSVFESKRQQELANVAILNNDAYISAFLSAYHVALLIGACFAGLGLIISLSRKGHVYVKAVK